MSDYPPSSSAPPPGKPKPIRIAFGEADLDRLAEKLDDAALPDDDIVPGASWDYGCDLSKLMTLLAAWRDGNPNGSDGKPVREAGGVKKWWRGVERRLNRHQHYEVEIEGIKVHYQMATSQSEDAIPLIFSHGWPGSFFEADLLLDRLSKPTSKGGVSFHVVVPSLIGYGLSGGPPRKGWTLEDTARVFNTLMTTVLGFPTYASQGGDWGYIVSRCLSRYPECVATHTNFHPPTVPLWAKPVLALVKMGRKDTAYWLSSFLFKGQDLNILSRAFDYLTTGSGYFEIQSTKPATIGYGLYDNPVGILSWLLEKFHAWSDPDCPAFALPGQAETSSGINDENILINVTWYYLTASIHTSVLPYRESPPLFEKLQGSPFCDAARGKPYGHSAFPYELAGGPKSWLAKSGVNLTFFREHSYGGHFAALDAPDALATDLRDFFSAAWPR